VIRNSHLAFSFCWQAEENNPKLPVNSLTTTHSMEDGNDTNSIGSTRLVRIRPVVSERRYRYCSHFVLK